MDDVKIHRPGGGDEDMSKYTPEQIREILAAREVEKKRLDRNMFIVIGVVLVIVGSIAVPLIARLWAWGFA